MHVPGLGHSGGGEGNDDPPSSCTPGPTLVGVTSEPLPLRAHAVLCLQGFRGEGYSEAFVHHVREVHDSLRADPGREIRLLAAPGTLCDACPHHRGGCTLGGADHESDVRAQDREVLARLGLQEGEVVPWSEILSRIARHVRGADLPSICGTCPWLDLGWCTEGVDALRHAGGTGPSPTR